MPVRFKIPAGKGNQVQVLSDPVTVNREYFLTNPLYNFLYEKERKICRSVSQETCLILEERLPKKVQFLSKRPFGFLVCLFLWKQAFFMHRPVQRECAAEAAHGPRSEQGRENFLLDSSYGMLNVEERTI